MCSSADFISSPRCLDHFPKRRAGLAVQAEEIRAQRERLHSQDEQLAGRQAEIERLQLLIAKLRRMQIGRRSEKLQGQIEQLELQLDELATARAEQPAGDATPPAVWFAYSPDRKGEHPQGYLRHFAGTLQADGYAGFDQVYETGRIREAACWAHIRRKFYDLQVAHKSPIAQEALERIAALYAIEKEISGRPPDERCAISINDLKAESELRANRIPNVLSFEAPFIMSEHRDAHH